LRALCGGEALPRDLADALLARPQELWNLSGPTETTIWSTVERVERGPGPITIGRPIANTQVYVLDRHGESVPVGIPGELWIGGAGVALDYHRRIRLSWRHGSMTPRTTTNRGASSGHACDARSRVDGTIRQRWVPASA